MEGSRDEGNDGWTDGDSEGKAVAGTDGVIVVGDCEDGEAVGKDDGHTEGDSVGSNDDGKWVGGADGWTEDG